MRVPLCLLHTSLALAALPGAACREPLEAGRAQRVPYEVWLVDQSDTPGKGFGGTLYVYDGADLDGASPASAQPRERIDLSGAVASLCLAETGANPVRPHMLLFDREQTHAVLAFVASGHVVILDAATRAPRACVRTTRGAGGQQAHAAFPSPDGAYVLVANQNGKRLERIDTDFRAGRFVHNAAATLDLATCTTPAGVPCEAAGVRPDNAPICPVLSPNGSRAFVTLRGGGLFVVDPRATPMRIVGEYDVSAVKGNGCGGAAVGGAMYVNSGGRPGALAHLSLYGFDVYRFPLADYVPGQPNVPAPTVVFSAPGEHDSHGMAATADERYLWVVDRHANVIEVLATATGRRLGTIPLAGALSRDPAPDLIDRSPSGHRMFVALRGPTPLSGDPHIATGATPGLGILDVRGDGGALVAVLRVTNVDAAGVERADAHAVRVRRK